MPIDQSGYNSLMNKLKQATTRNQVLIVTTSSGQNLTVDSNFGRHNQRQFKTDQGFFDYSMIHGYSFENDPTRQDAIGSETAYSDQTLLGGFVGQSHFRQDTSSSDARRNELTTALSGTAGDKQRFVQQRQDARSKVERFDNSGNGVKIPTIDLTEDQKNQIKILIQSGSDCDAIRSAFGNVSSTDLSSLATEAGIDTLSKIMQRLT